MKEDFEQPTRVPFSRTAALPTDRLNATAQTSRPSLNDPKEFAIIRDIYFKEPYDPLYQHSESENNERLERLHHKNKSTINHSR